MLRHGDAEDGSPDAERKLTRKGREQSKAAGQALRTLGVKLDACLTSPKVRAAQTAVLACAALGIEPEPEPSLGDGPLDVEALAAGRGDHVLLVGHDPDISMAVHSLTGARVHMKKGGLAGIERDELRVLLRPAELKRLSS